MKSLRNKYTQVQLREINTRFVDDVKLPSKARGYDDQHHGANTVDDVVLGIADDVERHLVLGPCPGESTVPRTAVVNPWITEKNDTNTPRTLRMF